MPLGRENKVEIAYMNGGIADGQTYLSGGCAMVDGAEDVE